MKQLFSYHEVTGSLVETCRFNGRLVDHYDDSTYVEYKLIDLDDEDRTEIGQYNIEELIELGFSEHPRAKKLINNKIRQLKTNADSIKIEISNLCKLLLKEKTV